MNKLLRQLGRIASGLVTVILLLILASVMRQKLTGEVPGLFGFHLMYVLTGSMSPEIEAGDAVLVKNTDAEPLQLGDVICYYGTKGEMAGQLITHKVIRTVYEENGEHFLQTQGVANGAPDDPIRPEQVFGKVVLRLRLMGQLYQFFCTVPGLITILLPIAIMMVCEVLKMVGCIKEDISESAENAAKAALKEQEGKGRTQDEAGNREK